jgi:hypothetical protein
MTYASKRLRLYGQARKRMWWMPRRQEAMKDVVACDKPRGAGKQALIRGFPNGETRPSGHLRLNKIGRRSKTWGTETSKYPEEKKSTEIPLVVASERGAALKPLVC